ncbi:Cypemycin methyltransferase [Planctomycetes bacterium CA13]|uniref:Cypemycin methyltransferase n=1 Tax=Novipirellula herctigrandis TaxID=2527986 RepID=A0A5C5Z0I1_9BACT|nr:Cypemycin methyltransferase [Planctomycetes bacterium CA13]
MNQPPNSSPPPDWRRPVGVAPGTWDYVHERTIADHYDAFVADTPLCALDQQIVADEFSLPQPGKTVSILDLGCGSGRIAIPLAEQGFEVFGVDLSTRMLELMLKKARERNFEGQIHAVRANLVELDCFSACSIDHAVCLFSTLGMIQGRANRRRMLSHVARIVRPGGKLVLHVHNRWAAWLEPRGTRRLVGSWTRSWWDRNHEFGDSVYAYRGLEKMFMHRFSRSELVSDFTASGWKTTKLHCVAPDGSSLQSHRFVPAGGFVVIASRS